MPRRIEIQRSATGLRSLKYLRVRPVTISVTLFLLDPLISSVMDIPGWFLIDDRPIAVPVYRAINPPPSPIEQTNSAYDDITSTRQTHYTAPIIVGWICEGEVGNTGRYPNTVTTTRPYSLEWYSAQNTFVKRIKREWYGSVYQCNRDYWERFLMKIISQMIYLDSNCCECRFKTMCQFWDLMFQDNWVNVVLLE